MILKNEFFILMFVTMALSQTIKYIIKLYTLRNFSLGHLKQTYLYSSGIPSSHTAVLTAAFLYLYRVLGANNPMVLVFLVFSYLWIYEIYMQRKRYRVQVDLLDSLNIKNLSHDEVSLYKDLSGHDFEDILVGIIVGVATFYIFVYFGAT